VAQAGGSRGDEDASRSLRQAAHRATKEVGEDYAEFHFNTALSKLMELTNALGAARDEGMAGTDAYAEAVDTLLLLLAPMAPHISEELWSRRGRPYSIHQQAWPEFDPALVAADMIELPVQVDGKLRDRLVVAPGTAAEEIERLALASEKVQAYLKGHAPQRVVQIPGRLVNIVTPGE
jgi:leucyl-tRNA synthetase